jgi:hypothetical protein
MVLRSRCYWRNLVLTTGTPERKDNDIHLRLCEKKKCDKVVKSLVRTDNDVEYESGPNCSRNNIVS